MDVLQDMFPENDLLVLHRAFTGAGGDLGTAIELILAEIDDEQSRKLRQAPVPAPLTIKPEGPPIQRPLLSPFSSADSLKALTISDADDWGDLDEDEDLVPLEIRPPPVTPQRRQSRNEAVALDNELQKQQSEHTSPDECLAGVLTIFPDACTDHIRTLYKENNLSQGGNIIEFIANKLAEDGYPRSEPEPKPGLKRKRPVAEEEDNDGGKKYEAEFRAPVSAEYLGFVLLLKQEFPVMPVQYINKVLQQNRNFLAAAYAALVEVDRTYNAQADPPYRKLNNPRKIYDNTERVKMGKVWTEITNELDYARNKARKEELKKQMESDARLAAEINEKEHEESNMLIECACCFGDYPFDNMTHCNETHFFCLDCARRNAENEVGNGRYRLACMDGSGCKSEFSHREMLRFLDGKTLVALEKIEQEDALRIAEIDGFVTCPFCDYGAICGPVEEDKEFRCQNSECEEISCRLCQQKSHIPQTCEEFAKENKLSVRHTVEEAMTEAMVRKCNKCAYPYIKEYGCNKIHCNRCNTLQCYICSKTIANYDHFNDPSRGGKVGNCPLFDNTDQRHEEEIQAAAKKAVEKLREEDPELTEEDLQIQVSEAVKMAEQVRLTQSRNGGGPGGAIYHVPPYRPAVVVPPAHVPPPVEPVVHGNPLQRFRNHVRVAAMQQAAQIMRPAPMPIVDQNAPFYNGPLGYNPVVVPQVQQQRYRGFMRPPVAAAAAVAGKAQQVVPPPQPSPQNIAQYRGVLHRARPQQMANPPAAEAVRAASVRAAAFRQPIVQPEDFNRMQRAVQQAVNGGLNRASIAQPPGGR